MEHDLNILMTFGIKKIYNFDPYSGLAISTNIPQRLKTGFVLQGHKYQAKCKLATSQIKK